MDDLLVDGSLVTVEFEDTDSIQTFLSVEEPIAFMLFNEFDGEEIEIVNGDNLVIYAYEYTMDMITGKPIIIEAPTSEEEMVYDVEVDMSTPGITYVGQAAPGTATSQSFWRIRRITESGSSTKVDWAGGTAEFTHAWDSRALLVYGP